METFSHQLDALSSYSQKVKHALTRWKVKDFPMNLGIFIHAYHSGKDPKECAVSLIQWRRQEVEENNRRWKDYPQFHITFNVKL